MKKISRRSFLKVAGIGAAALGLAACGGSKDTGSVAGSTAAASGDTVKIGVYEPQSGDNGAGGKQPSGA